MVTLSRWRAAQRYERGYWEAQATEIAAGVVSQLDWYAWRADRLVEYLRSLGFGDVTSGEARVVEIGSGPIGIVAHFPGKVRVAVDPLEPFYARNPVLPALRRQGVRYMEGMGESIPCPGSGFDLAIVDNCIDHVRDVQAVVSEIARVLRPGGILYLTVNCRTRWGFVVHRILSRLRIDAGHPHTFTPPRLRALFANGAFRVKSFEVESAAEARRAHRSSPDLKSRVKGWLGSSDFAARLVAQRVGSSHPAEVRNAPRAAPMPHA